MQTATKYGNTQAKAWATGSSVMQDVIDQVLSIIEAEKAAERAKEEARQQALKEISRYMTNSTASTLSAATQSIIAETQAQVAAALKTGPISIYDINKLALQACHKVYKDETGRDLLVDNELDRQSVAGAIYRQEEANALAQANTVEQNSIIKWWNTVPEKNNVVVPSTNQIITQIGNSLVGAGVDVSKDILSNQNTTTKFILGSDNMVRGTVGLEKTTLRRQGDGS